MGRYINFVASRMRHDADATLPPPWQEPERWQDLAWVMATMENGNYPMDPDELIRGWDLTGLTHGPSPTGEGGRCGCLWHAAAQLALRC